MTAPSGPGTTPTDPASGGTDASTDAGAASGGTDVSAAASPVDPATAPDAPVLRVVSGEPTPEELAALVAVLSAVGGAADSGPAAPRPREWNSPARAIRSPVRAGPGAWTHSARPH